MFQDVLLETTPQERRRRKLTLAVTLLGEAFVIAVLVAIPLLYLDALPGLSLRAPSTPISVSAAPHLGSAGPRSGGGTHPVANPVAVFRAFNPHPLLPYGHTRANDIADSGPIGANPQCCGESDIPVIPGTNGDYVPPVLRPAVHGPRHISRIEEGMIIRRVEPVYPQTARIAHIEGEVTLRATIGTSGQLEGLQVVSGHPLLVNAAVAAVERWRFKPYLLNGSPIEVQSQITVRFVLQR
jgi:protein TonB